MTERAGATGASSRDPATLQAVARPRGLPARVTIDLRHAGRRVPAGFIGLSFETRDLPRLAVDSTRGNLVALLRSLGGTALRIGGVSTDTTAAWTGDGAQHPRWANTSITTADVRGLARISAATGAPVLLSVGLGHYDPATAATEARAAHRLLGAHLAGIEIGNEPDTYVRKHLRSAGWNFATYARQAAAYRAAIAAAAPGVPIAGPDASSGLTPLAWVRSAAGTLRPALLTDHYYPLTSCGANPTIANLLSDSTRAAQSRMLVMLDAIARRSGRPLRLDETNNISCRGHAGVSNTFAAALWAVDYATRAIASDVRGVNFHDLLAEPGSYSPLVAFTKADLRDGTLHARPEWYALLLASRLMGTRPLATVSATGGLLAHAFAASGGRVMLVLVNERPPGSRPLLVKIGMRRRIAAGTILRLRAPSLRSRTGVTLGGRSVAANGSWSPGPSSRLYVRPPELALPAASAALVTLTR